MTMPVKKFSPSIILTKFIGRANHFQKIKKSWQKEIVNVQIQGVFFQTRNKCSPKRKKSKIYLIHNLAVNSDVLINSLRGVTLHLTLNLILDMG